MADDGFLKPMRRATKYLKQGARAKDGRVKQASRVASAMLMMAIIVLMGAGVWLHVLVNGVG